MDTKLTFTQEDVLVAVPQNQYERGYLVFSSIEGREIGKINVLDYRNLKRTPFKEPMTYLAQLVNFLLVGWNVITKLALFSPVIYFWIFMAIAADGAIDLKQLSIADLYSPAILQFSIFVVAVSVFLLGIFRSKTLGFMDSFKKRFHRLLEQRIPALKDLSQYKKKWIPAEG